MGKKKSKKKTTTKGRRKDSAKKALPESHAHRPPPAILPGVDPVAEFQERLARNTRTIATRGLNYNPAYAGVAPTPPPDVTDEERMLAQFETQHNSTPEAYEIKQEVKKISEKVAMTKEEKMKKWLKDNGYLGKD